VTEFAAPVSSRLHHSLEVPLTLGERARIVLQLGTAMLAGSLLVVGWTQREYGSPDLVNIAELIIAVAAFVVAAPIFISAVRGVVSADPHHMADQLVALATLAAMMSGDFVTATLIPIIMHLGHFFEERSILGAQAAVEGLRRLHAWSATVLIDGSEREIRPENLRLGDLLLVRPGEVIAADGEVVEGTSAVDQSSITGESSPEDVQPGAAVYAGTVNLSGVLRVGVARTGSQTALGRVVALLRDAEQSKTPALKLIEQYAGYYVPVILIIAGVVLFVTRDMSRAVAVLVVGCPGALILAGPTAMVAALAAASRLGILIKNTRFLESLSDVDTVVLDKTGTVTLGKLEVVHVQATDGHRDADVLREAVGCAAASRHPASQAILAAADATARPHHQAEELAGKGIRAEFDGQVTLLGRRDWLIDEGFKLPDDPDHPGPIVWLGRKVTGSEARFEVIGAFLLADVPRPEAKAALSELRQLGLKRSLLLTGDRRAVAEQIGQTLQFDEVMAEVLPEQKLEVVRRENEAGSVLMVGDGVNDALALAGGDVGVALGAVASDVALQSADVALMTNDLGRLPMSIKLARRTRKTIHQNILGGAGLSILFVWLASVGTVGPLLGALLHTVGEAFVIGNSARLLGFGGDKR
jgi:Cd2+/Zn2+-exporting ATPase/Cu+-exporting ATPase